MFPETKTAWLSKINWTQAVGLMAMVLTWFGVDLPDDVRAQIVSAIVAVMAIATWILRTFFTKKLTHAAGD